MNSLDNYERTEIRKARITAMILAVICISVLLLSTSCRKDYSVKPSPFKDGDYVRIKFDATKSFVPHCGTPEMRFKVTNHYLIADQIYWWYDLKSDDGCILIHVDNEQLKRY